MTVHVGAEPREPSSLSWRIEEHGGATTVAFTGEIDEHADFTPLRSRLRGVVGFELGAIRRINSCGVREWVNFVPSTSRSTNRLVASPPTMTPSPPLP